MSYRLTRDLPFPVLPGGTVTFLFTDIEGSTQILKKLREKYASMLDAHREILRASFGERGGHIVDSRGEEFFVAFERATDAVSAAVQAQRGLVQHPWPEDIQVRVRMGLHTGEPLVAEEGYVGMDVHRASRIANLCHGGQVLLSETTAALVIDELPNGVSLLDLGRHSLKDVARPEQIHQLVIEGLAADFPPLRSLEHEPPSTPLDKRHHNLPPEMTQFIGREDELVEIKELLTNPSIRLLTLLGVGGMGKTRLALRAAAELVDDFPDGVWLVEFARLRDPELVPQHSAEALSVSALEALAGQDTGDVLINYLQDKSLLLLMDNCEHLIQACAELAERLLRECPQVRLLATSRENLGIPGEHTFIVPPMEISSESSDLERLESSEAISLFIARAKSVSPMFRVIESNILAIRDICHRLDGMPLAIELAASRIKILSPHQIFDMLHDRFQLLTGGPRTALPRHQTLHATLEWSYNLLTEPEQTLFKRLSVFSGGWTLDDVEGLLAEDGIERAELIVLLSNLVDKSLVTVSHRDGSPWYGMLATVGQFASERLSDSSEVKDLRRKHAQYFISLAEEADPKLRCADQYGWLKRLDTKLDNFRAALEWLITSGRADDAARLVGALGWFWYMNGNWIEARRWLTATLDMVSDPEPLLRAKAICRAGGLEIIQGNLAGPPEMIEEALEIFTQSNDKEGMAWCLNLLGQIATYTQQNVTDGVLNLQRSIELFTSLDDPWGIAWSTRYLGQFAEVEGNFDLAIKLQEDALATFEDIGDVWNIAHSLDLIAGMYRDHSDFDMAAKFYQACLENAERIEDQVMGAHALQGLGISGFSLGQISPAKKWLQEALEILVRIGDENCSARTRSYLARVAIKEEDYELAEGFLKESIEGYQKLNRKVGIAYCLLRYVEIAKRAGVPKRASQLLGAISSIAEGTSSYYSSIWLKEYEEYIDEIKNQMGDEEFQEGFQGGTKLDIERAVAFALGESFID